MRWWFGITLWKRVMAALVLGVAFGFLVQTLAGEPGAAWIEAWLRPVGDGFIRLIRMMIVPLIFFTLVAGVAAMKDPARLGSLGLKTIFLYLITTFFANVIGLSVGTVLRPGAGVDLGGAESVSMTTEAPSVIDRILAIIPENPVAAMADTNVLSIIFFALLFGVGILMAGRSGEKVGDIFSATADVILKVTHIVMEAAPFGVFALVAYTASTYGLEAFQSIAILIGAVYLGLAIHMIVVYGFLIRIILRLPVKRFFQGIFDALAVAFSTSSSAATLPVTISNVSENLGVRRSVAGSVLPLGATINMDGTALYLGILALFTAQAFGYEVTFVHYVMIAITAAVVSIGAAGIPSASLFLLAVVLTTFDVSDAHIAIIVGFILPVDRIMDMARTAVNVTGDAAVAVTVAKWEGEIDEDVFRAPPTS